MQILVTIGSEVSEEAWVEFPTFPFTCVVVLKTLRHYRASVWYSTPVNSLPAAFSCSDLFDLRIIVLHPRESSSSAILFSSLRASVTDYQLVRLCVFIIVYRCVLSSSAILVCHRHRQSPFSSESSFIYHREVSPFLHMSTQSVS